MSGRCCRFAEYGHTLFISQLEADVLLADAPAFEGPVTPDACPFQVGNLCTAREPRPLGCRVYFCDPAYQDEGQRISETYLRQLKDLADELGVGWRYAPLHTFLSEALVLPGGERSEASADALASLPLASRRNDARVSLPLVRE